jgi:pantothenate kinase
VSSPDRIVADIATLAARAEALIVPGKRTILGITGAPGAGKSTLCDALAATLGDRAAVVGMDAYHLADAELERLGRRSRKGAPDTFDVDGYAALLERLRESKDEVVYAPTFLRTIEASIAGAVPIGRSTPLILTEGNYLLVDAGRWPRVRAAVDEVWFVELPSDVRRHRLVRRHEAHGKSASDAADWVANVDERNAELVERSAENANLIIELATDA